MLSQRKMKEEAANIRDRLKKELGEKGFGPLFEEAKKNLIQEAGPWPQPSFEEIVMTMGYMLEEKKRGKAFDRKGVAKRRRFPA
jgi:hypothetical protein